jgi:hypothetical protein
MNSFVFIKTNGDALAQTYIFYTQFCEKWGISPKSYQQYCEFVYSKNSL